MNSSRSSPAVRLAPEGARATSTSALLIAALIEMPARTLQTGITECLRDIKLKSLDALPKLIQDLLTKVREQVAEVQAKVDDGNP